MKTKSHNVDSYNFKPTCFIFILITWTCNSNWAFLDIHSFTVLIWNSWALNFSSAWTICNGLPEPVSRVECMLIIWEVFRWTFAHAQPLLLVLFLFHQLHFVYQACWQLSQTITVHNVLIATTFGKQNNYVLIVHSYFADITNVWTPVTFLKYSWDLWHGLNVYCYLTQLNPRTSKGVSNGPLRRPIGFSELKFEVFKQSKWNFQYL